MENAGMRHGLTPSAVDADAEDRSRSAALRARIAILAAGPDPEPEPSGPPVDIAAAVSESVRALLPDLVRETVGEAIRGALEDAVGVAVTAALPAVVGPAVTDALRQQRDDVIDVVDRQVTELRASVIANATLPALGPDALAVEMVSLRADVVKALATMRQQVAEHVAERFSAIRSELRSDISAEVTAGQTVMVDRIRWSLTGQIEAALTPVREEFVAAAQAHHADIRNLSDEFRALVAAQVAALRDASDEVEHLGNSLRSTLAAYADEQLAVLEASAERSSAGVSDLSAGVRRQLTEVGDQVVRDVHGVVVAGQDALASIAPSVRGDVQAMAGAIRTDVTALTGSVHDDLETLGARVRRDVEGATASVRAEVTQLVSQAKVEVDRLISDVRTVLADELKATIAAAQDGAVATTGAAVERGVDALRSVVATTEQEIAANRSEVALFSDRFVKAGHALLEHLAARDLLLEQAHDELLAQLLADLTAGMPERDRSAAGVRLTQIAQRRRDARDAERWREGRPPVPALPSEIKDENALVALLEAPLRAQAEARVKSAQPAASSVPPESPAAGETVVTSAPFIEPPVSGDSAPGEVPASSGIASDAGDGPSPAGVRPHRRPWPPSARH